MGLRLLAWLAGVALPDAHGLRRAPSSAEGGHPAHAPLECGFARDFAAPGQQQCAAGPFGDSHSTESPKRLALVIRGESFRSGQGQGDRNDMVTRSSWEAQREASDSQVAHIARPLEDCGFKVDVFIATYGHSSNTFSKNATRDLLAFYGTRVKGALVVRGDQKPLYTQGRMYGEALELVSRYHQAHAAIYDAILVIRHDFIFLQSLIGLANVHWQDFLLAFKELPLFPNRIADVLHWFPWKYANCAVKCGFTGHRGDCYLENVGQDRVGFLLPGEHNSNTRAETNALYRQVRGAAHERRMAVLLACNGPWSPWLSRGASHAGMLDLHRSNQDASAAALRVVGKAFAEHVLAPNNQHVADVQHKVDVIAHCWAPMPEQPFRDAFGPVRMAVEDYQPLEEAFRNKPGVGSSYWRSVAWAYSAKRAVELLSQHESETGSAYQRVLFFRPDTLILKDVDLDVIMLPSNDPAVHAGSDDGSSASFHLAMSRELAAQFTGLYDSLSWQHPAQSYQWLKAFFEEHLNSTIIQDDIASGVDEAEYWRLPFTLRDPCSRGQLGRLRGVGFTEEDAWTLGLWCPA